jgi:molybdopterin converting factor subunit 1
MTLRVRLFALAKETVGAEACAVELPEAGTVAELKNVLAERFPALATTVRLSMVAVNADYASPSRVLLATDDIALIPPVSGG